MDKWELEFGGDEPSGMGELMHEVVDGHMQSRMSANQRAAAAWYRANGDRERAHTTGVFLKKSRVSGAAPILGVYVDSHAMATDFGVNKDIYLARLANVGFAVSGIQFMPSRKGYRPTRAARGTIAEAGPEELPELSDEEKRRVESLVADLPDDLRSSASKAIALSMKRQKHQTSKNWEQS
ncbi:MAG: hypothetical protein J6D34_05465 [Atopobiaceae bacterium]|nr:hypothetical protein [Atopobiaceae bacterium]